MTIWMPLPVFGALVLLLGACDRVGATERPARDRAKDRATPEATEPSKVVPAGTNTSSVSAIAKARCSLEQRCGNVGPGKAFSTLDQCQRAIAEQRREQLNAFLCAGGIDEAQLEACLREIREDDCGGFFDELDRYAACQSSSICRDTAL